MTSDVARSSSHRDRSPIRPLDSLAAAGPLPDGDPALVVSTCANCGARLVERTCRFVCRCGFFLTCSDDH